MSNPNAIINERDSNIVMASPISEGIESEKSCDYKSWDFLFKFSMITLSTYDIFIVIYQNVSKKGEYAMSDYIKTMRQMIGHETLFTVGCGAIIEDQERRILLQRRKDQNNWCVPGGVMEINETFEETVKREVLEESGLMLDKLDLFGIYSGGEIKEYPNGDKVYSVQIIFICKVYHGQLKQVGEESLDHRFFHRTELPQPLNPHQASFILDWAEGNDSIVIIK